MATGSRNSRLTRATDRPAVSRQRAPTATGTSAARATQVMSRWDPGGGVIRGVCGPCTALTIRVVVMVRASTIWPDRVLTPMANVVATSPRRSRGERNDRCATAVMASATATAWGHVHRSPSSQ